MAAEQIPIDIAHNPPTLKEATETVMTTGQRVPIQRDGKPVAYLVPADQAGQQPGSSNRPTSDRSAYPTIASLAGAAGTLPHPLPWDEIVAIAGEDQIREKLERERSDRL